MCTRVLDKLVVCGLVVLATLLLLEIVNPLRSVRASHASGSELHLSSLHSGDVDEFACIRMEYSPMSLSTAYYRLTHALYHDNPSGDWDNLNNGKIYFLVFSDDCAWLEEYDNETYQDTELEYIVITDSVAAQRCGYAPNGQIASCHEFRVRILSNGHWHHQYSYPVIQGSRFNGSLSTYRHVINHETGHALGLADPGSCTASVMHSTRYFCSTDYSWPTSADRTTAISVSNLN